MVSMHASTTHHSGQGVPPSVHRTGRAVFPHPALGRVSHQRMRSRPQMEAPHQHHAQVPEDDLSADAPRPARRDVVSSPQDVPYPICHQPRSKGAVVRPPPQHGVAVGCHVCPGRGMARSEERSDASLDSRHRRVVWRGRRHGRGGPPDRPCRPAGRTAQLATASLWGPAPRGVSGSYGEVPGSRHSPDPCLGEAHLEPGILPSPVVLLSARSRRSDEPSRLPSRLHPDDGARRATSRRGGSPLLPCARCRRAAPLTQARKAGLIGRRLP